MNGREAKPLAGLFWQAHRYRPPQRECTNYFSLLYVHTHKHTTRTLHTATRTQAGDSSQQLQYDIPPRELLARVSIASFRIVSRREVHVRFFRLTCPSRLSLPCVKHDGRRPESGDFVDGTSFCHKRQTPRHAYLHCNSTPTAASHWRVLGHGGAEAGGLALR